MKKRISTVMAAVLVAGALTACGSDTAATTTAAPSTEASTEAVTEAETTEAPTEAETETEAVEESGYRMGMAVVSSMTKSADAGEKDGSAQIDSVAAVIVLDEDGVIVDCVIDTIQSKMVFDAEGKLVTSVDTLFDSKKILKDAYGMKPASGIGKEWYEQIAVFEEYVIGKTVDEVTGIAVDETTAPTDEDRSKAHRNGPAYPSSTLIKRSGSRPHIQNYSSKIPPNHAMITETQKENEQNHVSNSYVDKTSFRQLQFTVHLLFLPRCLQQPAGKKLRHDEA